MLGMLGWVDRLREERGMKGGREGWGREEGRGGEGRERVDEWLR
jgi:hypothetical protein